MKEYNLNKTEHSTTHLTYDCKYHVVFCPKYRRKVLVDGIDSRLKEIFLDTAKRHQFEIVEMEVMPDHVHLLIDCNPRYGIMQCVNDLKRESSSLIVKEFASLKSRLPNIWTRSAYIKTVGSVSLETVKQYIENQKNV